MLTRGRAKKLTVYLTDADRHHGKPLYVALVELAHRHGLAGATASHALLGYGRSGALRADLTDLPTPLPVKVEIIDEAQAIERFLPEVDALVEDALIEVSDLEVVKPARPPSPPAPQLTPVVVPPPVAPEPLQLAGTARMLRIHVGADDTWEGEPLYEALVKRFHLLDLAGVTVYRGFMGYGRSGRVHRHQTLRHADDPITLVAVDTAENLARVLPLIDEMVASGMVVLSDVEVLHYREHGLEPGE